MHTLFDFMTHTKGVTYVLAGVYLVVFLSYWLFLNERERRDG
jgi:hypothetical protein